MPKEMAGGAGPGTIAKGAGYAFALLFAINLFNYIDRQILSATLPKIRLDAGILTPGTSYPTAKLGALTTAFMVAYMLFSPVFGRLGDRVSRWLLVGVAVLLWSLATGGTGIATGYLLLLFTRCLVGVGEAAYGPVAPAMLSDLYPINHRGRILSWFYLAIPVGSALGFLIGGQIADTDLGWRGAFKIVVIPGLVLGVLCFFMREPRAQKPESPSSTEHHHASYWQIIGQLRGNRSFVLCCAGMTASTFVLGGLATVMQLYIFEREARFKIDSAVVEKIAAKKLSDGSPVIPGEVIDKLRNIEGADIMTMGEAQTKLDKVLSSKELEEYGNWVFETAPADGSITNGSIGLYLGAIIVVGGMLATLLGGTTGDWLRNRGVKGAYFLVAGWGTLLGFPFFVAALYLPFPLAWLSLFFAVFALFFNTGPANTIVANVTRSEIRASAFAINILIIHALGDAISPLIIGIIADLSGGLHTAFLAVSFLIPVAGLLWITGARYLDTDTQKAESPE